MSSSKDVDSYIANADKEARSTLEELRELIKSTIPATEEGIKYNVPFYEFDNSHVGLSAHKNHATIGIGADALQPEDRKMLEEKGYKTGKETIQIKYGQKVPSAVLKQLLTEKANEAKESGE